MTIDKVMVHRSDESDESNSIWLIVADVNGTYDLLKLRDGNDGWMLKPVLHVDTK
ncbi:MAG: hypothetical protein IE886_07855 [Campylobacterales bacterium]|nr:hypothetical protein [Campylobacterales bacterium]